MKKPLLFRQNKISRNTQAIVAIIVCVVFISLAGTVALLFDFYFDQNEKGAGNRAKAYTQSVTGVYELGIQNYENQVSAFAAGLSEISFSTRNEFIGYISAYRRTEDNPGIEIIRFFKDGIEYSDDGTEISDNLENIEITRMVDSAKTGYAGHFYDRITTHGVMAFVEKVDNFPFTEYIVLFYSPSILDFPLSEKVNNEVALSEFTVITGNDGEVLHIPFKKDEYSLSQHNNIYGFLGTVTGDSGFISDLKSHDSMSEVGTFTVLSGNDLHIAAVGKMKNLSVFSFYKANEIYDTGSKQVTAITGAIIAAFSLLFIALLYFALESQRFKRALATVDDWNAQIECDTRSKFTRNADEIISENKDTKFAVISIEMKHFDYLDSHSNNDEIKATLQFLKFLYKNTIRLDEAFGYESKGVFLLLWRFKEATSLENRLLNLKNIAQKYEQGLPLGFKINLAGGIAICEIGEHTSTDELINRATAARTSLNQRFDFSMFRYYNENMESERIIKENVETQMEFALDNEEFEIFFQPKLNITTNKLVGSEALVRWFNKSLNEEMLPDAFIPLFEANGFIERLDFYVFERVCQILRYSIDEGKMILPISVNVSRVTSSKNDFLEKYINTKKRYRIPNGFITIEFTESYAYEEYERLQNVVNSLRSNGFKCSIDDFGTKYSTFNTLKVLTMDELKLDKFFIEPGPSGEKSAAIIESVINLAHKFDLTIVQEGVETPEQMKLLKDLGCDVIQGFYCSRPLPWVEYQAFILDHKIKEGYKS